MSSHHIVTDNQEPAIVVTDEYFNTSVLEGLLEWGSKLVVLFPALERVISLGMKVDEAICLAEEKRQADSMLHHQFPHYRISIRKQEQIEFSILKYLQNSGLSTFNIVTAVTSILSYQPLYAFNGEIVIYQGNHRCVFIDNQSTYSKWFLINTEIKLLSIVNGEMNFQLKNLAEIDSNTYKVVETGIIEIEVLEGSILVCHDIV